MRLNELHLSGSLENKRPMENYMKNHFTFLGIKSPDRKRQSKDFIKASKQMPLSELFKLTKEMYNKSEREYQYIAIDMIEANVKRLDWEELKKYSVFVQDKSWWDSTDAWRKVFGLHLLRCPDDKDRVFYHFYQHENMWMRRISIILQLNEKENTSTTLLELAILNDINTQEFFIQKAIGWSLRQYGKVNSQWVIDFTNKQNLTSFAKKEALKLINQ